MKVPPITVLSVVYFDRVQANITFHGVATSASADRKFGVKARLCQALGVSLSLLRNYTTSPKLLQPIVHVLKLYAANGESL